jgi:hypothetical protein
MEVLLKGQVLKIFLEKMEFEGKCDFPVNFFF